MAQPLVQPTLDDNLQSTLWNLQWTVRDLEGGRTGGATSTGRLRSYMAGLSSGRTSSTGREWTRDWGKPDTRQMGVQGHHHHTSGTATDQTKGWGTSPKDGAHHQKMGRINNTRASTDRILDLDTLEGEGRQPDHHHLE